MKITESGLFFTILQYTFLYQLLEFSVPPLPALDKENHRTLRVLSKRVKEEDVRAFVEKAAQISEPGDRNNVDA